MFVGTNPPRWQPACRGPGAGGKVKCQAQNANSCWQAVQKTCSLRLGEPWYFTKSNEHVRQHCRATIGLFKEEIQKAGRCYITGSRDCLRAAQQTRIAFVVVVILLLQSPSVCEPPATLRVRHKEVGRTTYWFTLFCHCCALIRLIYSWTHVHICCLSPALSSPKQYVAHSWSFAEHLQDLRSRFNLKHYNSGFCCCWMLLKSATSRLTF